MAQGTIAEIGSLDEQVRPRRAGSQPPELRPQATLGERSMETSHRLTFNDRALSHDVVTNRQPLADHLSAEFLKLLRNSGPELVHIGCHHDHMVKCRCDSTAERNEFEKRAPTSHFAQAKWRRS